MAEVRDVQILRGYCLRLWFDDGRVHDFDVSGELWRGPVFEPLRDLAYFRQVRVDREAGTLVWPNGLALDPDVLAGDYEPAQPTKRRPPRRQSA